VNITLRRVSDESFRMPLTTFYPLDAGQFKWKIPPGLENHDDYFVRVIPNRRLPNKPNIMASKSKPFTVVKNTNTPKSLKVMQPQDGAVWYGGQVRFLQWKFDGASRKFHNLRAK
jgi:hypothetical protein